MPDNNSPTRLRRTLVVAAALAAGAVAWGLLSRHAAFAQVRQRTAEAAVLHVNTTRPTRGSDAQLLLPGTLESQNESGLYARVQGYVRRLHADIGQQVRAGQLLAEIDTPELDEQVRQAEADLATSRAAEELARSTAARWQQLLDQKLVARQTAEEKIADARVRKSALDAQMANVARLHQLQAFRRITAPFDGTVTARNANVGQLVTAAGAVTTPGSGAAAPLFRVASHGALRIFLSVPQGQASLMQPGVTARVLIPEQPGQVHGARVVRTAGAIDPMTRMLRVELAVDDPQGQLLPGAFVQAAFAVPGAGQALRLPVSTLILRGKGTLVAVVTPAGTATLRSIQLGRDFGTEYEVVAGLTADDAVILNPPDSLLEGQAVRVTAQPSAPAPAP